ncbi:MAG: hypothetical protein AMXMBFR57_23980 [Acidimicrobiia bacterium]
MAAAHPPALAGRSHLWTPVIPSPIPTNEPARLAALRRYDILDSGAEAEFDDFTRLAARICGTPVAQITFVDRDRQWFKSNFGVDIPEIPRAIGFCSHTILGSDVLEVPDMLQDERFHDNPLVAHTPSVRFYAGAPLVAPDGSAVGSLCVLDRVPKALTDDQRDALEALSRQVVRQLELRVAIRREQIVNTTLAATAEQLREANRTLSVVVEETETRLRQSQKVETIGLLASGIAHDFNNLLTVINGTAELAAARLPDQDPASRDLAAITAVGRQAADLTRQLLSFTRKTPVQVTTFDLNQTVSNIALLANRLLAKSIKVSIRQSEQPLPVVGNPGTFDQVLLNLVVNARDAMPNGGQLSIETGCNTAGVQLVVSDTGCGMDEATRARIFEPFFTTKDAEKGTGLGLSTVRTIVEKAHGTIEVCSEPGAGTSFVIRLPHPSEAQESLAIKNPTAIGCAPPGDAHPRHHS